MSPAAHRNYPRRAASALLGCALALTGIALALQGSAQAAPASDPLGCATGAISQGVGLPAGTAFFLRNGFNGTHSSVGPSTISYGLQDGPQDQVLGVAPAGCVLNGIGYSSQDGYLYAYQSSEVVNTIGTQTAALVRIGLDASGQMAIEAVPDVSLPASPAPGPNLLAPAVGDIDGRTGIAYLPAGYLNATATALSDPDNFAPYIASYDAAVGGDATTIAQTYGDSCIPYLRNLIGQQRLYLMRMAYLAAIGSAEGTVEPEGGVQDWSVNPADGMLYGYASVDLRQSGYASPVPVAFGGSADGTQTYLGVTTAIPAYSWAPAGTASAGYTLELQSDWIVRTDPASGATTCAAAGDPAASGSISLPSGASASDPVYDGSGAMVAGGGTEIAGSGFTAADRMQLFDSEQGRHFALDVGSCTFGSAAPSCSPAPAGSLPGGRQRGDGAAIPARDVTVRKVAVGGGSLAFPFALSAGSDSVQFALADGEQRTIPIDAAIDALAVSEGASPGWTLQGAVCSTEADADPASGSVEVRPGRGDGAVVCTFTNIADPVIEPTPTPTPTPTPSSTTGPTSTPSATGTGPGDSLGGEPTTSQPAAASPTESRSASPGSTGSTIPVTGADIRVALLAAAGLTALGTLALASARRPGKRT